MIFLADAKCSGLSQINRLKFCFPFPYPNCLRILFCLVLSFVSLLWGQATAEDSPELRLPDPDLSHLEKAVTQQLKEGRDMVVRIANATDIDDSQKARSIGELGALYHAYTLLDDARICYETSLELSPGMYELQYSLGFLLQTKGLYQEALDMYQKIDLSDNPPSVQYLIQIRMGECHHSLNHLDLALVHFKNAETIFSDGPAALARLGELALESNQPQQAIQYLTRVLEVEPGANRLHYSLAMAYRASGDMDSARDHLAKRGTVGIQPPDPLKTRLEKLVQGYRVHLLAGRLAFSAGRFQEAADSFNQAISADPSQAAPKINYGVTLSKLGRNEEAFIVFDKAFKEYPDNLTLLFNLGACSYSLGKPDRAIFFLGKVVNQDPDDALAHFLMGKAYWQINQATLAFDHFKTAIRVQPDMADAWVSLANVLSVQKQDEDAVKALEEARNRLPHSHFIRNSLARLLASASKPGLRNGPLALELSTSAFQDFPCYEYAKTLAMAHAQCNQCEEAVNWVEKALELARKSNAGPEIIAVLERNAAHFKNARPCNVPLGE